ncbi:hypothetical protein ABZW44_21670 [Streptomyces mirabilis]|uniref:hypothetical protein n=1 Tax=Streptomyces mirabilis TaxID=68239 RepID=UPI0033BFB6B0
MYAALARRTALTARTAVLVALGGITTGVGEVPDPREARIERLKAQNAELKDRVTDRDATIGELTEFKKLALCRRAAQHDEIMRLRGPQSSPEPAPPSEARRWRGRCRHRMVATSRGSPWRPG